MKAVAKIKANEPDFYKRIGALGGRSLNPEKGFGTNRELARIAGAVGGSKSRRNKKGGVQIEPPLRHSRIVKKEASA